MTGPGDGASNTPSAQSPGRCVQFLIGNLIKIKIMRLIFIFVSVLIYKLSFGQISIVGDTLKPGVYDTIQIEIKSVISFPFCSNNYKLPRECEGDFPTKCCSYSTYLQKDEKTSTSGFVSCENGSSLSWFYNASLEDAKLNFESIPTQWEKQQKTFLKRPIKCFVFDKQVDGYIIEQETYQGNKYYTLITYGSKNGFYFLLKYHSQYKITCNEDIQPVFRQFLRVQ
ncbi:MAG TPA: hypothetical protein DDY18_00320 [Flavobacterium sp.]|nr:hypothetical protein [Flavobacterium sp.]